MADARTRKRRTAARVLHRAKRRFWLRYLHDLDAVIFGFQQGINLIDDWQKRRTAAME